VFRRIKKSSIRKLFHFSRATCPPHFRRSNPLAVVGPSISPPGDGCRKARKQIREGSRDTLGLGVRERRVGYIGIVTNSAVLRNYTFHLRSGVFNLRRDPSMARQGRLPRTDENAKRRVPADGGGLPGSAINKIPRGREIELLYTNRLDRVLSRGHENSLTTRRKQRLTIMRKKKYRARARKTDRFSRPRSSRIARMRAEPQIPRTFPDRSVSRRASGNAIELRERGIREDVVRASRPAEIAAGFSRLGHASRNNNPRGRTRARKNSGNGIAKRNIYLPRRSHDERDLVTRRGERREGGGERR